MFNNLLYQRQIASDRQQVLLRQAGASRLRRAGPTQAAAGAIQSGPDRVIATRWNTGLGVRPLR